MTTFPQQLKTLHSRTPERVAIYLQFSGREDLPITYDQLLQGANTYASTLMHAGVKPGEVVVLILQHGASDPCILGDNPSRRDPLHYAVSDRETFARALSRGSNHVGFCYKTCCDYYLSGIRGRDANDFEDKDSNCSIITIDQLEQKTDLHFDTLAGFSRNPQDIALLQHSSGTTGLQKGVALSHQAVFNQLNSYGRSLSLSENDVIVSWLPLYHDMGLIAGFVMPVLSGVPLVLSSPFDWVRAPYKLLQSISKYRGTLVWLPNFAYNFCAQKIRDRHIEGVDLSSLRAIINCSEPVRWESHQAFYERFKTHGLSLEMLQTSYAMAENVFSVTQSSLGSAPAVDEIDRDAFMVERVAKSPMEGRPSMKMMSSGKPISNVKVSILDEQGQELPERVVGEITLQSNSILTGYYNRPDLSEKAFRDGWYLTSDYGYIANGEIFVSGRKKDMIIVGGKNIYPQDLELLTYEVPGVHAGRSVAFGMFDENQGTEDVVVIAEVDLEDIEDQQKVADAIRLHVTKNSAIALRYVKVVGSQWILKTSSGKTARSANKEKFLKELEEDK